MAQDFDLEPPPVTPQPPGRPDQQDVATTNPDAGATAPQIDKAYWLDCLSDAERAEQDWRKRARDILQIYRNETRNQKNTKWVPGPITFNILFANTEVMLPAIYQKPPQPVVRSRFTKITMPPMMPPPMPPAPMGGIAPPGLPPLPGGPPLTAATGLPSSAPAVEPPAGGLPCLPVVFLHRHLPGLLFRPVRLPVRRSSCRPVAGWLRRHQRWGYPARPRLSCRRRCHRHRPARRRRRSTPPPR